LQSIVIDPPPQEYTVVRAGQNRRAGYYNEDGSFQIDNYLWPLLRRAPMMERRRVEIGAGHGRKPRRTML
jgi:hypothetical protein